MPKRDLQKKSLIMNQVSKYPVYLGPATNDLTDSFRVIFASEAETAWPKFSDQYSVCPEFATENIHRDFSATCSAQEAVQPARNHMQWRGQTQPFPDFHTLKNRLRLLRPRRRRRDSGYGGT